MRAGFAGSTKMHQLGQRWERLGIPPYCSRHSAKRGSEEFDDAGAHIATEQPYALFAYRLPASGQSDNWAEAVFFSACRTIPGNAFVLRRLEVGIDNVEAYNQNDSGSLRDLEA